MSTPGSIRRDAVTDESVLARAQEALDGFVSATKDTPYEIKGVFFSEMLFVLSAAGHGFTGPVLESGRARGQSTFVLGRIFPDSKIISIEFDRNSPDVPIAEERLTPFGNIKLLFGDSQKLLFEHLKPDSVVIIDGPKGFRALRLALQLLKTGKARMVFVHDTYKGLPTRRFLSHHVPGAIFSDHGPFVERFRSLDEHCWQAFDTEGRLEWQPAGVAEPSYGPTFGCLPHVPGAPYRRMLIKLHLASFVARMGKSFSKLFTHRGKN